MGVSYPWRRSAPQDPALLSPGPRTTQGLSSPPVISEGGGDHRGAHLVTALTTPPLLMETSPGCQTESGQQRNGIEWGWIIFTIFIKEI